MLVGVTINNIFMAEMNCIVNMLFRKWKGFKIFFFSFKLFYIFYVCI